MLIVAPVVLTVVIVGRSAMQPESYITWAVFGALLVSGLTTVLQAVRVGRFGSGHVLVMGTSGAFIAVCLAALVEGGPALMASLIIVSSVFQFLLAERLAIFRRLFTPLVSGIVFMLVAVTVMPVAFETLMDVPDDTPQVVSPIAAFVTLVTVASVVLRGSPVWRLWAPIVGIVLGCIVSAPFGLYDTSIVADAPWLGLTLSSWPGIDVTPSIVFWGFLPAFFIVTIVGAIETIADGIGIQQVSRRQEQAIDFRVLQGAINADGVGNLLSGLVGTLPNTTYFSSGLIIEVTRVAARRVGIFIGILLIAVAFFPKFTALFVAIPGPVASAYITVLIGLVFIQGMDLILRDGIDHRKAVIVGISFWIGVGFQNQMIYPNLIGGVFEIILSNGMTAGAFAAMVMMLFLEYTAPRPRRLNIALDLFALDNLSEFLISVGKQARWNTAATQRLTSVGEEMLAILEDEGTTTAGVRQLAVTARRDGPIIEVEVVTALEGVNMEDSITYLSELPPVASAQEVSYRLLHHYASSVQHQKYYGVDIITVTVDRRSIHAPQRETVL